MFERLANIFGKKDVGEQPKVVVAVPVTAAAVSSREIDYSQYAATARAVVNLEEWVDPDEISPVAKPIGALLKQAPEEQKTQEIDSEDVQPSCCGLLFKKGYKALPTQDKAQSKSKGFAIKLFGRDRKDRTPEVVMAEYGFSLGRKANGSK